MSLFDIDITELSGRPGLLSRCRGRTLLVVNVASRCALSTQYAGLTQLARRYADDGLVVIGVPCNQFGEQEPGTPQEIAKYCAVQRVDFPLSEKVEVNGPGRHALYAALTPVADAEGHAGDVRWNFEKFVVSPTGRPVARFAPTVDPLAPELLQAVRNLLDPEPHHP
ncbi:MULTISPECIES: glutathione peroxidase [Streptomyces]|uniref:Glutathione peroxidase n=1 Tax=Streptomyces luteosporeus TaxID=173856 RepID=A0ABN3TW81_9ACTN